MATAGNIGVGRLKAHGSARSGSQHWWWQRVTALANVPLVIWFVASAVSLSGAGYAEVRAWLGGQMNATLMVLLVVSAFWHARLGLQVVIEDYVHSRAIKLASLLGLDLLVAALATSCLLAILKVSFGS